eukprot:2259701-Pyramimonas_sp.AAC.1
MVCGPQAWPQAVARCTAHMVAKSQRVLGQLSEDVVQWLSGGVAQMSTGTWTAKVEKIVAEAERHTRRYNGERKKEWRAWAAKSLTGGA